MSDGAKAETQKAESRNAGDVNAEKPKLRNAEMGDALKRGLNRT